MSIYTINNLKISAENEDAMKKARLLVQSKIENEEAWDCTATKDVHFDQNRKLHIFELQFNPCSPPFETYAELQAIEGVSIEATLVKEQDKFNTRYRWTGEGCNLIAVQTYLNPLSPKYQNLKEDLKFMISCFQKDKDYGDEIINKLRSLDPQAQEGGSLS